MKTSAVSRLEQILERELKDSDLALLDRNELRELNERLYRWHMRARDRLRSLTLQVRQDTPIDSIRMRSHRSRSKDWESPAQTCHFF